MRPSDHPSLRELSVADPQATDGSVTAFALPAPGSGPFGICSGPDGALWFTRLNTDRIGRITTDGEITEYDLPTPSSEPHGVTVGPDGAVWAALETGGVAHLIP
jgi:virginiamycin B lyase